jgi:putative glutathione S-transferase
VSIPLDNPLLPLVSVTIEPTRISFTVPVLWDRKEETIVNNESSEIIRMFNTAFNDLITPEKAAVDLYPANLAAEIDCINDWVYDTVNSTSFRSPVGSFSSR